MRRLCRSGSGIWRRGGRVQASFGWVRDGWIGSIPRRHPGWVRGWGLDRGGGWAPGALFGGLLDTQHAAERTKQAGHAGIGLQQGRHLRVADQALQFLGEGGGGGQAANEPAVSGGEAAVFELARPDCPGRRGGGGVGLDGAGLDGPSEDVGEAGQDAGQAVPDADDLWAGHACCEACDDDGAECIDHQNEAVGGGEGGCPGHEHNKNICFGESQGECGLGGLGEAGFWLWAGGGRKGFWPQNTQKTQMGLRGIPDGPRGYRRCGVALVFRVLSGGI